MTKTQIARKYSRAVINIFNLNDIPKILEELLLFSKLVDLSKKLKLLLTSRIFTDEEKDKALKALVSHMKISEQSEKFLRQIIMQGHLSAIKEIIKASTEVYNEHLKKTTAMVIAPIALEKDYIARLKEALKSLTRRDVDIESQIDPSLLGGFVVKVGSTVYDSSLKGQLNLLKGELTR